jgi:hypothetical protein
MLEVELSFVPFFVVAVSTTILQIRKPPIYSIWENSDFIHFQTLRIVKMSTSFSSLPTVSLSALSSSSPSLEELAALSSRLNEVFSTTGFAYLTDLPLTYTHDDVFGLCDDFFGQNGLSEEEKMKLAKKTFVKQNKNTYRGYVL